MYLTQSARQGGGTGAEASAELREESPSVAGCPGGRHSEFDSEHIVEWPQAQSDETPLSRAPNVAAG